MVVRLGDLDCALCRTHVAPVTEWNCGRERNKEAVSARANACRLRCPHHLHFGEAASRPCWRPWHHSRCNATSQERALRVWLVRREQATWHTGRQQAVLHQLMGHVLADRSCQEASDRLRFALSLHIVYSFITLGLLTAFSSMQTDRIHHLTRFFAPLAFGRPFLQSRPA